MSKNDEKRERKERFQQQIKAAMKDKNVMPKDIALATGLKYHIVNDAVHKGTTTLTDNIQLIADYLGMDVSWLPASTLKPPMKVTKKMMDDGIFMVTQTGENTVEEMEAVETKKESELPTMTDADPELAMNDEKPCIWVDGEKWTEDKIKALITESEDIDKALDVAAEKLNKIETQLDALQERYRILENDYRQRDKEAIKYQVEAEEYRDKLAEMQTTTATDMQDLTIAEAVKHYRPLKRLFRDEVLQ